MARRFGRSIRIGKNVRLNISKSGIGASVGVKGLRVSTGPRGGRITTSIPGTGINYQKSISSGISATKNNQPVSAPPKSAKIKSPGLFAPKIEKEFVNGLNYYQNGETEKSLSHFIEVSKKDVSGLIFSAIILAKQEGKEDQAISMLEKIIQSDDEFPSALMKKYVSSAQLQLSITDNTVALVPLDGLGISLILAELYQNQGQADKAISLLEEIEDASGESAVTLSLCDLYSKQKLWDAIIDRASGIESEDDITLETMIFYGRAMQEKKLHDAAISIFTKAIARKKGRNPLLLTEAKYYRALTHKTMGKNSQAKKALQEIYAEYPNYRDVKTLIEE